MDERVIFQPRKDKNKEKKMQDNIDIIWYKWDMFIKSIILYEKTLAKLLFYFMVVVYSTNLQILILKVRFNSI